MNEHVMRVLFGAQKQSLRQNVAIANFVEEYLGCDDMDLHSESAVVNSIITEIALLSQQESIDYVSDKLFLQYILGMEGYQAMVQNIPGVVESHAVGENGKVVFSFKPQEESASTWSEDKINIARKAQEECDRYKHADTMDSLSAEDEAWALIKQILECCPPERRAHLPADDALAAILLSKSYWAAN